MIIIDQNLCSQCGVCVSVCKPEALILYQNGLQCDESRCNSCDYCAVVCPIGAIKQTEEFNR
ncbi:MAG: 4Fe-4S binding protein [Candidatus Edwardsbacteria bacterium]